MLSKIEQDEIRLKALSRLSLKWSICHLYLQRFRASRLVGEEEQEYIYPPSIDHGKIVRALSAMLNVDPHKTPKLRHVIQILIFVLIYFFGRIDWMCYSLRK